MSALRFIGLMFMKLKSQLESYGMRALVFFFVIILFKLCKKGLPNFNIPLISEERHDVLSLRLNLIIPCKCPFPHVNNQEE